ncbi:hypothetical protein [Moorena sp. SIO4G3]|uniref:hypothetical protein n=1 Tax=Moorena sp. SIO4G3 TaxID=2607821 RepID=UPI00142947D2|nr:hypothetical protein [Moorena sp. SIO4G3]NEO78532.1 hypothetical protein [Moorena sp. SIO4G3]
MLFGLALPPSINRHLGGTGILVERASWWNGHLGGTGILPVTTISGRTIPTLATKRKMSGSPKLVRYGADYPNPGDEAKNNDKSAPNTPYFNIQP